MNRLNCQILALLVGIVLGTPRGGAGADEVTVTDELGAFSISYPAGWSAISATGGAYSQIGLFGVAPHDISIVAASRGLSRAEQALEPEELLDELVLLTVDNQGALGNEVIEAGRVDPFVPDWPAFSVVATDPQRRKMITCWRFVVGQRVFTLTTMTDNSQASPELGAAVRAIIESFRVLDQP